MLTTILNKIILIFIWCVIKCSAIFVKYPIAARSMCKKVTKCPGVNDDILLLSATSLAEKIRNKILKSETIVQAYITRINEVNPIINAVIEQRFTEALEEARAVDKRIENIYASDELILKYPLLGVPVTVKGSIAVKGLSHCAGRYYKDSELRIAKCDADIVNQVKEAGAIILLISSTPELCCNFECSNNIIGTTGNPYDTRRTCGGSSGGEAALLGSGASVLGLGSDIAGSLRLPAFYCGVYGHKPSPGVVSTNGHYPNCTDLESWESFFTLGPMTRYAEDLSTILQVILKPEKVHLLKLNEEVKASSVKIYYMLNDGGSLLAHNISRDIVDSMSNTVNCLQERVGCDIQKVNISEFKNSTSIGYVPLLKIDGVDHCLDDNKKSGLLEMLKIAFGCSKHSVPSVLYVIAKKFFDKCSTQGQLDLIQEEQLKLKKKIEDMLGDNGVLIFPTFPATAGFHQYVYYNLFDGGYLAIFNSLGFPVTNCPIGFSSNGLPIGLQIVAKPGFDRLTIAIAKEIEGILGGWKLS